MESRGNRYSGSAKSLHNRHWYSTPALLRHFGGSRPGRLKRWSHAGAGRDDGRDAVELGKHRNRICSRIEDKCCSHPHADQTFRRRDYVFAETVRCLSRAVGHQLPLHVVKWNRNGGADKSFTSYIASLHHPSRGHLEKQLADVIVPTVRLICKRLDPSANA